MPLLSRMTRIAMLGLAGALLVAADAARASSQTGRVETLIVRASDGLVYVHLEGAVRDGRPACAMHGYWMIRDENSAAGKRQYALLLVAKATGRRVVIQGSGQCTRWSDGEDINELYLID